MFCSRGVGRLRCGAWQAQGDGEKSMGWGWCCGFATAGHKSVCGRSAGWHAFLDWRGGGWHRAGARRGKWIRGSGWGVVMFGCAWLRVVARAHEESVSWMVSWVLHACMEPFMNVCVITCVHTHMH